MNVNFLSSLSSTHTEPEHLIGYARVSRDDQNPRMQFDAMIRHGVDERNIYYDTASGGSLNDRPQLHRLIRELREGDIVVVWKLDRFSRDLADMLELVRLFHRKGARFRSLTEHIDTTGPTGEMMLHLLAAFAQYERSLIRERTRAGLERARREGRPPGRRAVYTEESILAARDYLELHPGDWKGAQKLVRHDKEIISIPRLQARIRKLKEAENVGTN